MAIRQIRFYSFNLWEIKKAFFIFHLLSYFCNMKITVIIPVYNTQSYLTDCLDSLLVQTFPDWEAVCVNDGSTDSSIQVLQEYARRDGRIRVVSQTNQGLSAARNAGIEAATGEWIFFLDSDDCLSSPHSLRLITAAVTKVCDPKSALDVVAFNSELWYPEEDGRREENVLFNHADCSVYSTGWKYLDYFVHTRHWGPSAACFYLWRYDFLQQHCLRFPLGLLHEDEWFVPEALTKAQGVLTLPETIYTYRMRTGSIAHTHRNRKAAIDKLLTAKHLQQIAAPLAHNRTWHRIIYNLARNASHSLKRCTRQRLQAKRLMWQTAHTLKERVRCVTG